MATRIGTVSEIYMATDKGKPMELYDTALITAGYGLSGDRYGKDRGAFSRSKIPKICHLSLIAAEAIEAANQELEYSYTAAETRRNIVTRGVELNDLVGREFRMGGITLRGVELCVPCRRPEKLSGKPGFETAFQNRGGLRAAALTSGLVSIGDHITS